MTILVGVLCFHLTLLAGVSSVITKYKANPLLAQQGELIRFVSMEPSSVRGQVNVNHYRDDWMSPRQGGGVNRTTIGLRQRVYDPSVGGSMSIDLTSKAGKKFRNGVETVIDSVAPEVMNFQDRQATAEYQRQEFQQHFQQGIQKKEHYIDELRRQSEVYEQKRQEQSNSGMSELGANLAAALDNESALTMAERRAREDAAALASSPLRTAEYEFNLDAAKLMETNLQVAAEEKRFQDMSEISEALTYGKTDGKIRKSKVLEKYARPDGVLKVGGTFDNAKFKTPIQSPFGQSIRRLANRYQSLWAQSNGLSVLSPAEHARYTLGALAVSLADSELSQANDDDENIRRGAGFLSLAQSMAESIAGFGSGVADSLETLAKAIPELAILSAHGVHNLFTSPEAAWDMTFDFIMSLPEMSGQVLAVLAKDYTQLKNGTAYERGEVLGRYALDIVSLAASAGAGAALKGSALGVRVGELGSILAKSVPMSVQTRAGLALTSSIEMLNKMPVPAREALEKAVLKKLPTVPEFTRTYVTAVNRGQTQTVQYLERVVSNGINGVDSKRIAKLAKLHSQAFKTLDSIPGVKRDGVVSRAIAKEVVENGVRRTLTVDDVFKSHWSQLTNDHRYTIGGPLGNSGLYMTEGSIADTSATLIQETRKAASDLIMAEKRIQYSRLLDLTDERTLRKLGLDFNKIEHIDDYSWTQMIGDAAKQKGYEGIIFRSTKGPLDNIVIFN